jgi:pimeloyl-ACP methyl ester carboxylesterase
MTSMTTFLLVPGAGGQAWYWHRVVPLRQARGHAAVAVELPAADEAAGLAEYADAIVAAAPAGEVVVVAQPMGGFAAPLVADQLPGETAGQWWDAVDQAGAARAFALAEGRDPDAPVDPWVGFFHDGPAEVTKEAQAGPPPDQADRPFGEPRPLPAWPDVPTRFLAGRADRLFPLALQRRIVPERLGIDVEETPGGHLAALSEPEALVERLLVPAG